MAQREEKKGGREVPAAKRKPPSCRISGMDSCQFARPEHHLSSEAVALRPSPPSLPPPSLFLFDKSGPSSRQFSRFLHGRTKPRFRLERNKKKRPLILSNGEYFMIIVSPLPFLANPSKEVRDNLSRSLLLKEVFRMYVSRCWSKLDVPREILLYIYYILLYIIYI